MKEIDHVVHSDLEVSAIASVLSYLSIGFKTDLIFGFGEGIDFRIEKRESDKVFSLMPRVPLGQVITAFFDNFEITREVVSVNESNIGDVLGKLESEDFVMIARVSADNIPVIDSKKNLTINDDFCVIYDYNKKHTTVGVNDRKKAIVISSKHIKEIMLNSPNNECIIFNKKACPKKINMQKVHIAPLKNVANRLSDGKKATGIKAMFDFNKELMQLTENYDAFVPFAENHFEIWYNQSPDKKGYRGLYYEYLNLLIKNVDDPTGEIKCCHEIFKEMRNRWDILTNLMLEASKDRESLSKKREEILQRYHFISVESEPLAIKFLSEL